MRTWSVRGTAFALCTRSSSLSIRTRTSIAQKSSFGDGRIGPARRSSPLEGHVEPGHPPPGSRELRDVLELALGVLEAGDGDPLVAVDLALELVHLEHQAGDLQLELVQAPPVTKAPHREEEEREGRDDAERATQHDEHIEHGTRR